jgi:hypothetical protein
MSIQATNERADRHPFAGALETRDGESVEATLAPGFTYNSPVVGAPVRDGTGMEVLRVVIDALEDVECVAQLSQDVLVVLLTKIVVGGHRGGATWLLLLDEQGRIRELTWHARPFTVSVALADAIGTGLARHRGRAMPALVAAMRPVGRLVALGVDTVGARLAHADRADQSAGSPRVDVRLGR